MPQKIPTVYILANKRNGTLYTGVTSDLIKRIYQHKQKILPCFSKKYDCTKLVYYEIYGEMSNAIKREKQIKAGNRKYKIALIERSNPRWQDLYDNILI